MGTVSWTAVARADMYLATATGNDGHTHTCISNSTDCSFTDLHCSETYAVNVVTIDRGCHSDPSPDVELRTALCPPIQLEGIVSCSTNILSLTWDASPVYGAKYTLHSQKIGGANTTTSYPTSDTSLFITGLQCGEHYAFQVVTSDGNCNSSLSRPLEMDTAPCQPTHLAARVDCGTNRGKISWFESLGASYYIAEVTGGHGHVASCTSNDTSCAVKLHCGQTYSAILVASTDSCNSTLHAAIEFDSAPCLPENVVAELNCNSNVLAVQWQQTPGDGDDTYTALVIGSDGYQASCNSTSNSCSIFNLQCGQTYEVAVTSSSINCSIIAGSDYQVQSAPCKPQNTTVDLECSANVATVIWDLTSTAQNYTVTATDVSGTNTSCSTNETSCSFSELSCGEMYTFSVVGHTKVCMSEVSSPMQMLTAPCVPTNIASSLDCGTGMALITWNSAVGATAYTVQAEGNHGHNSSCSDTGTQCSLKNLVCGQEYSVVVVAMHTGCPGPGSQAVTFTTAPCPPQSVETQLDCLSGRLNVAWQPSVGATRYHATVQEGSNVMMCDTNTTSCVVPNLSCGNAYNITVVAQGQSCNSSHSAANEISTAPCPPTSLSATVDCSTNIAMVTWDSQNALGVAYRAQALDVQRSSVDCNTTDSNCALTRLQCGSEYNVTVTASKDNCWSIPSLTFTFTTAPCVPLLSDVQLLCSSDSASITWATAAGAELYEVTAEDGQGGSLQCNSSDVTSCQVSSLQCGQQYVFSVTALDRLCASAPSAMIQSMTAPCPPQNIHTSVGCENRTACISWTHSQGALSYTARLHTAGGEAASCSSNTTGCDITSLPCGETYTVTVAAEGHTCNSSQSSESPIKTAPCVPSAPMANLSCSTNMAAMTWNSSLGADLYSVEANSSAGHSANCQSAGLSCELTSLQCGQTYTVTVTAQDSTCTSASSQSAEVKTVPCMPTGVKTDSDCLSNAVTASWFASDGSEYYIATLEDGNGMSTTCKSVGTQCTVAGLQCGQVYHVTVAGSDDKCTSPQSVDTHTHSVPCLPSSLQAIMDCEAVSATVSWQPSAGTLSYVTMVMAGSGHNASCATKHTNCEMSVLECGEDYTVTVRALGESCSSVAQMAGHLTTEPCVPMHLSVSYSLSIAQLFWDTAKGATSYSAQAITDQGLTVSCHTNDTNCALPAMACGQLYNVTVSASNSACNNSVTSKPYTMMTEPCTPTNVQASMDCNTLTGSISWEASDIAVGYAVVLEGQDGHSTNCLTTATSCDMGGLNCGTVYYVYVRALGVQFNSSVSSGVGLSPAPCLPSSVQAQVDCGSDGAALLSWSYTDGANNYTLSAMGVGGDAASCTTEQNQCNVTGLSCGGRYNITLTATNQECQITVPINASFDTRPCSPQHVAVDLTCGTQIADLSWEERSEVELYESIATRWSDGAVQHCNSTGSTCQFTDLACGATYSFTVTARSNGCHSPPSNTVQINTVPCVPSLVEGRVDCVSGDVSVTWKHSNGATAYTAIAQGNEGYAFSCNTSGTVCVFNDLLCGHTYSVTVSAADNTCSSAYSSPITVETEPCEPQNVSAHLDCHSNEGVVSWEISDRVTSHLVTAVGPDGHRLSCNSTSSSCTLPTMHCGQRYNLTVTALEGVCDNSRSQLTLPSGPCAPGNLQTSFQCSTNSTSVTWDRGSGALSYMVVGEATNGHITSWNSSTTDSDLEGLQCGQMYNVSVHSMDGVCRSIQSVSSDVQTAPCPPQNVDAEVYCASGIMLVTWDPNMDVQFFLVDAVTKGGRSHSCNTTDTQCFITSLPCGESFSVQVTAARGGCHSMPSQALNISSAPCMPTGVNGSQDCVTNNAWVSWAPALGVDRYMVTADGVGGYNSSCSTHGSDTTCEVPDLACGVRYNFSVTASNGQCDSPPSATFDLETPPCALASITAFAQCHNSSILVLWEPMVGSVGNPVYIATAEASDRSMLTCNSSASSCDLEGARCGLHYTVIVAASSDSCTSQRSPPYRISMEPCPPQGVVISSPCESHGAHVSWTTSPVAETYLMTATGGNGDVRSCKTTANNCSLSELQCGQQYAICVTASHENCSSGASQNVTFNTVPCQPEGLSVLVQCANHSALLSWTVRGGVVDYRGCGQAEDGTMLYCESTGTSCAIGGLECGAQYNFSVQASDGTCNSSFSEPLLAGAAPCPPETMAVTMFPMQNQTQFLRASWTHVTCPNVQYLLEVTGSILGDSQSQFELSSYWTSSSFFELLLPCGSSYSATVRSRNFAGDSAPSAAITGTTAPCPPPVVTYSGSISSATISWNASVYATMYTVYDISGAVRNQVCSTVQLSCSLANLNYNNLEVTASNTAGESDPTREITVHHLRRRRDLSEEEMISETSLSKPVVRVTVETPNVLLVEWSPVKGAAYYTLVVREQSSRPRHASRPQILTVYGESSIVANLKPSSTYCLSASAHTEDREGPYSEPVCVETVAPAVKM
ncbi:hypothetical protein J4Q44_G00191380 [Coregonus suidteri]|uniref:Fibronectin type-III domain-containing protein n=1 Tax=Coregonus suidteri TaxID=861788 RepID=A0AAN8LEK2_9TELE